MEKKAVVIVVLKKSTVSFNRLIPWFDVLRQTVLAQHAMSVRIAVFAWY